MAQHDLDLANGSGAALRADLNLAMAALGSTMKGPNAPPAPLAGMLWLEDDNPSSTVWTLKIYDGADWIAVGTVDSTSNVFTPSATTVGALLVRAASEAAARQAIGFTSSTVAGSVLVNLLRNLSANSAASTAISLGNDSDGNDGSLTLLSSGATLARALILLANGGDLYLESGAGLVRSATIRANTSVTPANVAVDAGGQLRLSTSLREHKADIQDLPYGLAEVLRLRPVSYRSARDEDGPARFGGLIMEEVLAAGLPEFVAFDSDGKPVGLHYPHLVALAFAADRDLHGMVSAQAAMIASLQDRLAALEAKA